MKYVYICQKDVATVMVWDWNNPLEWKIMYGGEILLDFDSQQAFIAGDEGCDQWPPFAVKRAAVLCEILNVFQKTSSMCQKTRFWHPICQERLKVG